jgi:hypothetical protein
MKKVFFIGVLIFLGIGLFAQTATIQIDAQAGLKPISPGIYGRNNSLSDNSGDPLSASEWQILKDAGIKMFRENGGNNATKYNWRKKLSSHPDWYNNVYAHNWDYAAQSLQANIPGAYSLWAFQLIGKAASNTSNNFNDWAYNNSQPWSGVAQNLAGGGTVNSSGGSQATVNGNPDLYLMNWTADSTVGILNKWFGSGGLGLNQAYFKYWNMDNEPEIWNGTHDDVMPTQPTAEEFMQMYFAVAKKARAAFPGIKLVGPVPCNEWQWYNWNNTTISSGGKNYCWLEFFIKRIAEEQIASGVRLLDVLDIHFYPGETATADIVQLHRTFFDTTYIYPGVNGVHNVNGSWDNSINKEYVFERCRRWLVKYMGADHGVTFSLSEMDVDNNTPATVANWYASMLGTFADNGVEIFTPWSWKTGMWEVVHLFSRYAKTTRVQSASNQELYVSAYSSISADLDSLTVILVNRSTTQTYNTTVNISNFAADNGSYNTLTLSSLPSGETFVSHSQNALVSGTVALNSNAFTVSLPPLSIKAVMIANNTATKADIFQKKNAFSLIHKGSGILEISYQIAKTTPVRIELFNIQGKKVGIIENSIKRGGEYINRYPIPNLSKGVYIVKFSTDHSTETQKVKIL